METVAECGKGPVSRNADQCEDLPNECKKGSSFPVCCKLDDKSVGRRLQQTTGFVCVVGNVDLDEVCVLSAEPSISSVPSIMPSETPSRSADPTLSPSEVSK